MRYSDYVNIKQGTKSNYEFSNGNTLPLVQMPNGMIAFSQQTYSRKSWWYDPGANYIEGIRITHQPSPWIADYGCLLITPQTDVIGDTAAAAHSGMNKKECVLKPYYMKTEFLRSGCCMEIAPTERCAKIKLTYSKNTNNFLSLFSVNGKTHFEISAKGNKIIGYTFDTEDVYAKDFKMFFEISCEGDGIDFGKSYTSLNDTSNAAIHIAIAEGVTDMELGIAISYISEGQAELNSKEVLGLSFDEVKDAGLKLWESYLERIEIESDSIEQMKTFYSCMYRAFLFPHKAYEIDENKRIVHYSPFTGEVHSGKRYTGNGFWDTSRTNYPLYSMIARDLYEDVLVSSLNDYEESGYLPRWTAMGEVGCMPSTLIDSVIAQAAVCKIGSRELLTKLLYAMIHHAEVQSSEERFGRNGIEAYKKLGYVPCDEYKESVNLTLDFAYGDYCIAKTAECLGIDDIKEKYLKRAENYRNVFDKETGFMRGKLANGEFAEPFDPLLWGGDYTEACAWQTTFAVPHDLEGLSELMGGKEKLLMMLDNLFTMKPEYRVGGYKTEIHEMTEMAILNLGLSEMNNQPGFMLPYIYSAFGESEKCQAYVEKICNEFFTSENDGFPGDEDNGSMAAWYILSTIGKYPICPADNKFVNIKPLVKEWVIK